MIISRLISEWNYSAKCKIWQQAYFHSHAFYLFHFNFFFLFLVAFLLPRSCITYLNIYARRYSEMGNLSICIRNWIAQTKRRRRLHQLFTVLNQQTTKRISRKTNENSPFPRPKCWHTRFSLNPALPPLLFEFE